MSRIITLSDTLTFNLTGINTSQSSYSTGSNNSNAYTDLTDTTYSTITCSNGSRVASYVTYLFTVEGIPSGATISSVACRYKARVSSTSRITSTSVQLYSNTSAKGGTGSFTSTSNPPSVQSISSTGSWTAAELANARIRFTATRGTSQTSNSASMYIYGAELTVTYSFQGTAYTVAASSSVTGVTVDPSSQELLAGEEATVRIDAASIDDIVVTDNDTDVTSSLEQHTNTTETTSATFIPSSFDSTNSVYNTTAGDSGVYSTNYINNGLTDHNSTTRCALYAVRGSGAISKMYYNFDCSSIPANAIINSVSCQVKAGSQGSSYYSSYVVYLCSGTTNKTSSVSVTGSNSSPTTVIVSGGTWSRADLNNIKILFQVTRGSSNTTEDCTWSFFGATLTVNYTVVADNPYYWTYTLNNLAVDHVVLIDQAGVYIPPEEDPLYTYESLTISSINATTNPGSGTTRVVQGSNQTITITPSDPQLTLALDNGVDITSQLTGGVPTNTYTVTTKVSGATYGFNLNTSTGYYVSTNNGVSKSASVARINMDFESSCLVTIQYINYAEANYDYGMFGKLDTTVATDGLTASSNSSSPSDSTSNYQLAMCSNSSSAQTISYNVPAGQHYIDVKYGKDDSSNSNNDTLQWKVLSVEATGAGGDYTYTLNNIQTNHSLIFVFGNVSYYFVTSSGTNCRLFPDGQSVRLAGDSYSINIIPDNVTDTVVLTDNGIEQTLEQETGVDKYGNPAVSYKYKINAVNAAHTLVVTSAAVASDALYIKLNNTWTQISKVYKKVNGAWVEQSLSYLSSNNVQNLRRMS